MENPDVARTLEEVADLLEIQGANPFRVRAYRNAARVVEGHGVPLRRMVEGGEDLTGLPGVGRDLAEKLQEMVVTGRLGFLEELRRQVPPSLLEIMRLPEVGPRKTHRLWQELGVLTVADLERAAREGRVAALKGFGVKSQEKILEGIRRRPPEQSRYLLAQVDQYVQALRERLGELFQVERLEAAGSFRRRRETVGDLDILVTTGDPGPVFDRFVSWEAVDRVLSRGDTRASVVLHSGLQVDLRVVAPGALGSALCYFTGSKAHNIRLRRRAMERGLRLSEYGVFRLRDGEEGERVAGAEEEEVYAAVDLPWIPPELREDRGEIEAAEEGRLPRLLRTEDLRGDLQMHSTWSDGKNTLEEMVAACARKGYQYLAITDHSPSLAMIGGLGVEKLRRQHREIGEIQKRHPSIRILRSLEVDILADGTLDLAEEGLETLDLVVVSVHSRFDLPADEQTRRILKAVRHPRVDVLAHPTGRLLGRRPALEFDLEAVLRACAECGVAVELNAQPERLDLKDTHLLRARELGVGVVVSSDAHSVRDLDRIVYGVDQARRAWLEPAHVLNALPLEAFLHRLRRKPRRS